MRGPDAIADVDVGEPRTVEDLREGADDVVVVVEDLVVVARDPAVALAEDLIRGILGSKRQSPTSRV